MPARSPESRRTSGRKLCAHRSRLFALCALFLITAAAPGRAATLSWVGDYSTGDLADPTNWAGGVTPSSGDSLVFSGLSQLSITNSLASGFQFNNITFDITSQLSFSGGNAITLGGDITDDSKNHSIGFALSTTFNATHNVFVDYDATLVLSTLVDGTGSAGLTKQGAGLLTLNGTNGLHGPLTILAGTVSASADTKLGAVPGSATPDSIILDGGALRISAATTVSANRGIGLGDSGGGSGTLDVGSSVTYDGVIANNGGTGSLVKTGGDMSGTNALDLGGANTYTGSTTVNQGILKLDFSQAGAPSSNILYNGVSPGQLILGGAPTKLANTTYGGGALLVQVASSGNESQTFSSLTLNQGNNQINFGAASGGNVLLTLGGITHTVGGNVNFTLPSATPTGTMAFKTSIGNTHGILGGWATVTVGGVLNWAANDGSGNIVPYSAYTATSGSAGAPTLTSNAASNVQITSATTGNISMAAGGTTDVNTIQITDAAARTINIGAGNTLRLGNAGGIWRDASSVSTAITIGVSGTAGTLTAGGAANTAGEIDLIGHITESSGPATSFIVNSVIANNGTGAVSLVIAGTQPDNGSGDTGLTVLNAANTYTGGTYVNSGVLQANTATSLGTSLVTVMPGAQVILNTSGTVLNNFAIAGNTASNAWNATTHAALRASGILGASTNTITLLGDATIGSAVSTSTINSQITGAYNLTFEGPATITLTNPNNNYSGNTTISKATVQLGASGVIPNGSGNGDVIFANNSGTLDLNGFSTSINGLSSSTANTAYIVTNSAASGTATLTIGASGATASFGGDVQDGTNAKTALAKTGAGTEVFFGVNSYSGATNVNGGILQSGANNSYSPNSALIVASGAHAQLSGHDNSVGSISGAGIIENASINSGTNVLTVGQDNSSPTFSGTLQDGVGIGPFALTKTGTGTQTLSGTNSYSGPTTVNGGILNVTSTLPNSPVTVNGGGTFAYNNSTPYTQPLTLNGSSLSNRAILAGTGTIGSAVSLTNVGDTLSPGNSPGILTFSTSQTWNSFSYVWQTNNYTTHTPGVTQDQIAITGTLNLTGSGSGTYVINVQSLTAGNSPGNVPNFNWTPQTWTILTTTGGISGFNPSAWTVDGSGFTNAGGTYSVTQSGNNLDLQFSPVPEPSGALLVMIVGLVGILRKKRMRG